MLNILIYYAYLKRMPKQLISALWALAVAISAVLVSNNTKAKSLSLTYKWTINRTYNRCLLHVRSKDTTFIFQDTGHLRRWEIYIYVGDLIVSFSKRRRRCCQYIIYNKFHILLRFVLFNVGQYSSSGRGKS